MNATSKAAAGALVILTLAKIRRPIASLGVHGLALKHRLSSPKSGRDLNL
jgi:hypothetical protein